MKKILVIPAVLLSAGSFLFTSCGNSGSNASMKEPSVKISNADTSVKNEAKEAGETEEKEDEKNEKNETKSKF